MAQAETRDILIVGSGEAGKYLAWALATEGRRTTLVERKLIGGSCPNIACLPSKNIIHSAKVAAFAKRAQEFGLAGTALSTDMARVFRRKQEMVDSLVEVHLERFHTSGVDLIMGQARFLAERTIQVALNNGGVRVIKGEHMILSLGSRATIPDIDGLAAVAPMTHVEALALDRVPEHLIILGAGYVGLEFAQAMRRLGSKVTLLERSSQLLRDEDADVSRAVSQLFLDDGIEVLTSTRVLAVSGRSGEKVNVKIENSDGPREIEGTDLLVAVGRTPNTGNIDLHRAGVKLDARGYIAVNHRLETTSTNTWAVGDCAGSPQFTHVAFDDFRVVYENVRGGNRSTEDRLVPSCLFVDPELVRIGLNETEAKRGGLDYRLFTLPMASVLRTRTVSEPRGFMKMLVEVYSDRILGFTAFGVEASELLAAVQTAMIGGVPFTVIRDGIYTHPTIAEGLVFLLSNPPHLVSHPHSD